MGAKKRNSSYILYCTFLNSSTAREPTTLVSSNVASGAEDGAVGEEEMLEEPDACGAVQLKFDVEAAELLPMVVGLVS